MIQLVRLRSCSLVFHSLLVTTTLAGGAEIPIPICGDSRLAFTLFAAEPDIVTPVGVAVDRNGRVFVVESHTHFPKPDYPGPKTDRVKIFDDRNGDGKPETISVFAEGFRHAMNLAFSRDGKLYLVYRNGVLILHDQDGDGVCDSRTTVLKMETPGDYPHNGLGGIAFSADGWLYIGMGENLGERYTLQGSDGSSHRGGGEGGNVFRCRPDGSQLQWIATGFWNAFALQFNRAGHLFCVDNDPDSRPPCRLIDVVEHGDYGYKFRYGRNGLHPFTAWNGGLPGTLPMVAGTGEAPSGILDCDRARLPSDYQSALLITSWGDHAIERYRPAPFGASLRADREVLIRGDEWFRPVGIASGPEGIIYITDWVDRDYSVHRKGRIWRLAVKTGASARIASADSKKVQPSAARGRMQHLLRIDSLRKYPELLDAIGEDDPFIQSAAISVLAQPVFRERVIEEIENKDSKIRLGALLALRRAHYEAPAPILSKLLADPNEHVRLMALVWAGEEKLTALADRLNAALSAGPVSPELFRTYSTTAELLAKAKPSSGDPLTSHSAAGNKALQTLVMTMAVKRNDAAAIALLSQSEATLQLRLEAVRALAESPTDKANPVLLKTALETRNPAVLRAEAVLALASQPADVLTKLIVLLDDSDATLQVETSRAFRQAVSEARIRTALEKKYQTVHADPLRASLTEQLEFALHPAGTESTGRLIRPASEDEWRKALSIEGHPDSGRRLFFHPVVGCARCHRIEDRGGSIGPDLSTVARSADREKLMQSILRPSREIAPQSVQHIVETREQSYSGLLGGQGADGSITLITAEGKGVLIPGEAIVSRRSSTVSLMPEGLEKAMTVQDFRDLLAFMSSLK